MAMDPMYSDEGAGDAQMPDKSPTPTEDKQKDSGGKTALIDSAICPDAELGTEFVVKVVKKLEKQLLVEYSDQPDDKSEPKENPEMASSGGDSGMREMMS